MLFRSAGQPAIPPREADESLYWAKVAGDAGLQSTIEQGEWSFSSFSFPHGLLLLCLPHPSGKNRAHSRTFCAHLLELQRIVRYPSTVQTLKGLVSAGPVKSLRYSAQKVGKWWKGSSSSAEPPKPSS